jgi:hypothetical protein
VAYFSLFFRQFFGRSERSHKVPDVLRQGFTPDIAQLRVRQDAAEQHRGLWDKEVSVVVNVTVVQWNSDWAVSCR